MITVIRSADIQSGKISEAFAWGMTVTNYINENISGVTVQMLRNIGGPLYQIHWLSMYDSLADYEQALGRMEKDEGYQKHLAEGRSKNYLIGVSATDKIYQTLTASDIIIDREGRSTGGGE